MELSPAGGIQIALTGKYSKEPEDEFGKYSLVGDRFTAGPKPWSWSRYRVEFLSKDEMALTAAGELGGNCGFEQLVGRWKRLAADNDGPVEEAGRRVLAMQANLAKMRELLRLASDDRKSSIEKLTRMGIRSASDLAGNPRARQVAKDVAMLTSEMESLESRVAKADSELLEAKSLVRRLEEDKATLKEEDRHDLLTKLREVESRSSVRPPSMGLLDVEEAVERGLRDHRQAK